jgi:hypothetical protein
LEGFIKSFKIDKVLLPTLLVIASLIIKRSDMSTKPVIKKYYLSFNNTSIPSYTPVNLELWVFPQDISSTLNPKYSQLNQFGIYPYLSLRTHSVTIRYNNRYLIQQLEKIAVESLESGIPIQFGSPADYAAKNNNLTDPPDPTLNLNGNETFADLIALDQAKRQELEDFEDTLDSNLTYLTGFIELPIQSSGMVWRGNAVEGFSFTIIEVVDSFRSLRVGDLSFKLPPEQYSYVEETIVAPQVEYAANSCIVLTPGYIRKGFTVNLPSCYTDVLENLKYYRNNSFFINPENPGIDVLDNVGNSFNGKGEITSLNYAGAINKRINDSNSNNFLPNGLSFTVLSLESFIIS